LKGPIVGVFKVRVYIIFLGKKEKMGQERLEVSLAKNNNNNNSISSFMQVVRFFFTHIPLCNIDGTSFGSLKLEYGLFVIIGLGQSSNQGD
jgi:hypothetical protein